MNCRYLSKSFKRTARRVEVTQTDLENSLNLRFHYNLFGIIPSDPITLMNNRSINNGYLWSLLVCLIYPRYLYRMFETILEENWFLHKKEKLNKSFLYFSNMEQIKCIDVSISIFHIFNSISFRFSNSVKHINEGVRLLGYEEYSVKVSWTSLAGVTLLRYEEYSVKVLWKNLVN